MNELEALEPFISAIKWKRLLGARFAYIAYDRGGVLYNLHCRMALLPMRPAGRTVHGKAHGLELASGWLPAHAARVALQEMREGAITIRGRKLLLKHVHDDKNYNWWDPSSFDYSRERIGWAGPMLQGSGPQMGQVLDPRRFSWLADRLVAVRPFRLMTFTDLERFIGPHSGFEDSKVAVMELFAPACARLSTPEYKVRTKQLRIPLESYLDPVAERMEILVSAPGLTKPLTSQASAWKQTHAARWTASLEVSGVEGRVDVTLVSAGERLWHCSSVIPVLGARLLQGLDGGDLWLNSLLFPADLRRDSSVGFERGIVALLGLGGLPAVPTGFVGRDRYVDVVCEAGAGRMLIFECTVGVPAPKKLADLRGRTMRVLQSVQLPGEQLEVRSCVFTPLTREELPPEIQEEASKLGVTLLTREAIKELIEAAVSGDLAETLWARTRVVQEPVGGVFRTRLMQRRRR